MVLEGENVSWRTEPVVPNPRLYAATPPKRPIILLGEKSGLARSLRAVGRAGSHFDNHQARLNCGKAAFRMDHYNRIRLHSALGYVAPADKLAAYASLPIMFLNLAPLTGRSAINFPS